MDQMVRDSLGGIQEIKVVHYLQPELTVPPSGNPMPIFIGGAIGGAMAALSAQSQWL
jgi:hypothetical protein